ncbi:Mo-dependent nitrogenase C-terminal domain-containing protein [Microcoleus sp. LEGE 07076]|uniref:Mo-dependent nitrogenase C-terminal domain-containing protein n=1 Tax=Microcoleus sp. LEGE 07076 TaxID=915322 RepID=UPI00187DF74B|nr:Mo-dependent nitrogenase C-terminal domain-containing protein [Microcoleus sp. LEGE 07076]MBE9184440.1 Mo-dependent nitrogenase C-terminal domain-containing protein [Microcoleus sp. LEGE 07076]
MAVGDRQVARWLCQLIPAQCPFERDIQLWGHHLFGIPSMCKLNPVFEELVGLRFPSLSFLADTWGEDVTRYC